MGTPLRGQWGLWAADHAAPSSSQAYVDEFKFQSILADDFLDFFLDYFPELKKQRVDSIPGEERSQPMASRRSWRVGSAFRSEGPVCPLGVVLRGGSRAPRKDLRHPRFLSPIRPFSSPLPSSPCL